MRSLLISLVLASTLGWAGPARAQSGASVTAETVRVVARPLDLSVKLPGELKAFQAVDIHARVTGFIESIEVDRGSQVAEGALLATMSAPELEARRVESEAKIPVIEAQVSEARAKLAAAESTLERLREAAKTPGVVAGNDLVLGEKGVEAARSHMASLERSVAAARAAVRSLQEMEKYLRITAPFSGVITDRYAHIGALAGPEGGGRVPLLRLEQTSSLRLVVPVPEAYAESIRPGRTVSFTVSAYPGMAFRGTVSRPAHSVDPQTRTMPVEVDVNNAAGNLAPGMYAEVSWPVLRRGESLFVPVGAVKSTTERTFVVRLRDGVAEWVDVRRGMTEGKQLEVFGDLKAGDTVVARGTDEIRPGTRIASK